MPTPVPFKICNIFAIFLKMSQFKLNHHDVLFKKISDTHVMMITVPNIFQRPSLIKLANTAVALHFIGMHLAHLRLRDFRNYGRLGYGFCLRVSSAAR